ncbi:MAG: GerAB/ArcD/ProY family transporter [Eubacteriales bacterium]
MDRNKISPQQFVVLFWGSLLAPLAEFLATVTLPIAGRASFLVPLVALPILILYGKILWKVGENQGGLSKSTSKKIGFHWKLILVIYALWGIFLFGLRLRLCAERLMATGYRNGSVWLFVPIIALFLLWMTFGTLGSFARTSTLYFSALVVVLFVVMALSVQEISITRALPLWTNSFEGVWSGTLSLLGVLSYGCYAGFFLGEVEWGESTRRFQFTGRKSIWVVWCTLICISLAIILFITIGNFGVTLASELEQPFFQLAKGIGIQGAFQRVESVVAAIWSLADFLLLGVLLRGSVRCLSCFFEEPKKNLPLLVLVGAVIALSVDPKISPSILGVQSVFALGLPLVMVPFGKKLSEK